MALRGDVMAHAINQSTVSHRSEYTPHIFENIVLYLFM